jgi:hypothetical protein
MGKIEVYVRTFVIGVEEPVFTVLCKRTHKLGSCSFENAHYLALHPSRAALSRCTPAAKRNLDPVAVKGGTEGFSLNLNILFVPLDFEVAHAA